MPDHPKPTIPELFSQLRHSFQTADFDRVELALISRESNLMEAADLEKLEALRLADELNALKEKQKKEADELRKENRRLERGRSFLERECEALESRIVVLEDDVVNLETLFDSLIAAHKIGALKSPGLKQTKDEVNVKEEKEISKEQYEKRLEEDHRKDENQVLNLGSQKNNKVRSDTKFLELENEISRIGKFMNELKNLGLKNMDKMTGGSRKHPDPNHAINVEDYVPANSSPRGNGVGNSGTCKSSAEAPILLSDSDDDCAPVERKKIGLKRNRASSPDASDDNNCGHKFEQESFPTAENKQSRILRHCGSLVSNMGKQNNPSSCDEENLRPFEEKVVEKQKSEDGSSAKVNFKSDSSSSFSFSSDDSKEDDDINLDDSKEDDDINLESLLFKTNRA